MGKKSLTNVHTIFFLAALVSLPMLFQYIPTNDCAMRYAPMAEAFAVGDFNMAFHPRFLPLYPILTGFVCFLLKCSGYFACKFVCWLLFSFSVYPVFYLVKFISNNKKNALISSFLLIFCYPLMAFIGGGTRANLKSFLIIWLAWAFVEAWKDGKIKYLLWSSIFAALLTLTRGDSALYAIIVIIVLLVKEMFCAKIKFIYKPIIAGLLFMTILSPWLYFQYNNIGYPVPETRHAMLLDKISETISVIKLLHNKESKYNIVTGNENLLTKKINSRSVSKASICQIANAKISAIQSYHVNQDTSYQMFIKFLKCFFLFYLIFAVIGIVVKIIDKSWNKFDSILATMFLTHTLLIFGQIYIADHKLYASQRYIQTALPLYLTWVAAGFLYLYENLKGLWHDRVKYLLLFACLVGAIVLYQQGSKKIFRENITKRPCTKDIKEISRIINEQKLPHMVGKNTAMEYNFNIFPIIITEEAAIGYYSRCKVTSLKCAKQNKKVTNKLIESGVIHFIAIRPKYAKYFPALNNKSHTKQLYKGERYTLWSINK